MTRAIVLATTILAATPALAAEAPASGIELGLRFGYAFAAGNRGIPPDTNNDAAVSDPRLTVDASALNSDGVLKLSSGKKKHVLVKPA